MISSDVIRGYSDTIILSVLMKQNSYGYEISKAINLTSGGLYKMKETTLYSAFNRLEKNGFIIPYKGNVTFGKPRTYYQITDLGKQYYHEKCKEWELTKEVINKFT